MPLIHFYRNLGPKSYVDWCACYKYTFTAKTSGLFDEDLIRIIIVNIGPEGALSIEVWGHRSAGFSRARGNWEVEQQQLAKARSLADRWTELTRKIELWVEIHELNDQGEYAPVEVNIQSPLYLVLH